MNYPDEFSAEACNRIDREILIGRRDYDLSSPTKEAIARAEAEAFSDYLDAREELRTRLLKTLILKVFSAFCDEAIGLGKRGTWTVDTCRSVTETFLAQCALACYGDNDRDINGLRFSGRAHDRDGNLWPSLKLELQRSPEWHDLQIELLDLTMHQASPPSATAPNYDPTGSTPPNLEEENNTGSEPIGNTLTRPDAEAAANLPDCNPAGRPAIEDNFSGDAGENAAGPITEVPPDRFATPERREAAIIDCQERLGRITRLALAAKLRVDKSDLSKWKNERQHPDFSIHGTSMKPTTIEAAITRILG
jgi:hypothetical protein